MTVVDFRSGGFDDSRGQLRDEDVVRHAARDWAADDWDAQEWDGRDWDESRYATPADSDRLTDRDSALGRVARLTHYIGALVSVMLMVGLAVWGYQLVVRDVSGVPVIRAVEGEGRIAPDEPGGMLSDREGLAVNDVAAGTAATPVERVAIAPARTTLDAQDVAMGELGATAREAAGADDYLGEPGAAAVAMSDAEVARRAAALEGEMAAGVPSVGPMEADRVPVTAAVTDTQGQPALDTAINAALAEAGVQPAVASSARPAPRPRRIAAAAPAAAPVAVAESAPAADAVPTLPATRVASGTPLVQIGAFDSGAIAESEWSRVSGRYGDLFTGKSPIVQEHRAGGRTFYRLRIAGFETRDEARKFCAALIAAGTDCIPAAAQ